MRDDAVAPVIAVMLILAAVVTFLSIWNAVYVPSMKQAAEVEHLKNVETAFQHFSSDIEKAVSSRQDNLVFSEPVPLGGGDTSINLLKSSGTLFVQNENVPVYILSFTENGMDIPVVNGTIANVSYEPVSNFWQDQGYQWQYGYINVTKYKTLRTPLGYYNMTDVSNEFEGSGSLSRFAKSFGGVKYSLNQTPLQNTTPTSDNRFDFSPRKGNCASLDLWAVNVSASPDHRFASSNGYGTLRLKSTVKTIPRFDVTNISIGSENGFFGNVTQRSWNESFSMIGAENACPENIRYDTGNSNENYKRWNIRQDVSPVNVTLNVVSIEISAS